MNDKNKELYEELYNEYLESLPDKLVLYEKYMISFEQEISEQSYKNLVRIVHSMKGSAGSYGHHFLSSLCKIWELKLNTWESFTDHQNDILILCKKGVLLIQRYAKNPESCDEGLLKDF